MRRGWAENLKGNPMSSTDAPKRAAWAETDPLLTHYYDTEWGVPVRDETGVFERLVLEGFQAGLSWITVLRKREAFRDAFDGFDVDRVATYEAVDAARLMQHTGIIRNQRKITATITNAERAKSLREEYEEGIAGLVWSYMPDRSPAPIHDDDVPSTSPESVALARDLKRRGFLFVGPTTMYALMSAIGIVDAHLVSSHRRGCSGLWNPDGSRAG